MSPKLVHTFRPNSKKTRRSTRCDHPAARIVAQVRLDLYADLFDTVLAADPAAFAGYYRWDVYYRTTAGDVWLPVGYMSTSPIPVEDYLADHPQ
jgi:hypothetical protein